MPLMALSLQSIIGWLVPREVGFYEFLERQAATAHEGALALATFAREGASAEEVRARVQVREHEGDAIVHAVEEALAKTFVTPIDREDLQKLSSELDDILDFTNGAARACVLMGVAKPTEHMQRLTGMLVDCTAVLRDAVPHLRGHDYAALIEASRALRKLEKEADTIYRDGVHTLFHDQAIDAKVLLREKTVLEDIERAVDSCERVGDTLANLAIKNG